MSLESHSLQDFEGFYKIVEDSQRIVWLTPIAPIVIDSYDENFELINSVIQFIYTGFYR